MMNSSSKLLKKLLPRYIDSRFFKFGLRVWRKVKRKLKGQEDKTVHKENLEEININIEVKIEKLQSMVEHIYKEEYVNQGLTIFNLPVQKTPHFQFIRDYQNNPGLRFEDTSYWRLVDKALAIHREKVSGVYIHNKRGIITSTTQRCVDFIELYERIKSKGKFDPIEVRATYDGKYIITDGLHRAAIASALGYEKVPLIIISIDKNLLKLMKSLRDWYPENGKKTLYTPIDHPIFNDWKVLRDDTRWELIKGEFCWEGKKVLDIGSYTGYFLHKIAMMGGEVVGIELDEKRIEQAKMINILLKSNVKILHADFFEHLKGRHFNCVLLFSVLHWILKERGIYGVREALNTISSASPVMFFDMGQDYEPKMRLKEWNHGLTINKDTIPDLVIANSKYRYFKHLGTSDTGRDVFKFTTFHDNTTGVRRSYEMR